MGLGVYTYLAKGMSGNAVREMQNDLIQLGFTLPKYGADGIFGDETKGAVEKFQKTYGLPVTGVVDQLTANAIKNALLAQTASYEAPQWVKEWVAQYNPEEEEVEAPEWVKQWVQQYQPAQAEVQTGVGLPKIDWKWVGLGVVGIMILLYIVSPKKMETSD